MSALPDPAARRALQSLLAFWAEAGVDAAYADAPVDRLAQAPDRGPAPVGRSPPEVAPTPPVLRAAAPGVQAAVAEARAQAAEAGDLPALLALAQAHGPSAALLMTPAETPLVGWVLAAPDADDVAAGRLLAGPRGRLFAKMMRAAGLEGRVAVAAVGPLPAARGQGPDVAAAAVRAVFLERALQLAGVRVAVAAGAEALRALTGEDAPILKAHGRMRDWTGAHFGLALPLMPTFSLETLLAQPPAKARAWRDILTLRARVDSVTPPL